MAGFRAIFLAATIPNGGDEPFLGAVYLPCVRVLYCQSSFQCMFFCPSIHDHVVFFVGSVLEMDDFFLRYGMDMGASRVPGIVVSG